MVVQHQFGQFRRVKGTAEARSKALTLIPAIVSRVGLASLWITVHLAGCAPVDDELEQREHTEHSDAHLPANAHSTAAPLERVEPAVPWFNDKKGRRFVLDVENIRHQPTPAGELPVPPPERPTKPLRDMSRDELAEALRPVVLKGGHQYKLETPDYETADLAIRMRDKDWTVRDPSRGSLGEVRDKHFCCGTDDRWPARANTHFPYRTVLVLANADSVPIGPTTNSDWSSASASCTATLIGQSTALSAAHCFHSGSGGETGWKSSRMWGAGADEQDTVHPIPNGYPQARGEYYVTVPTAYTTGGGFQYDYAIIDFTGYNIPTPGATVGNYGAACWSEAAIEGKIGRAFGYPGDVGALWPQLRGDLVYPKGNSSPKRIFDVTATQIIHALDTSGGDSGQAFGQYLDGVGPYVSGIHYGHYGSSTTWMLDRRMSSEVCSAIVNWSSEY